MTRDATPDPRPPLTPREAAVAICRRLQQAGHTAYLAGGCVRDRLLGREPEDYDVATDAHPERVLGLFRRSHYVGEAFGVVLVSMGPIATEVATFRVESGYSDKRRPDRVRFTDAEHDARRRDFTINGLFEDPLAEGAEGPGGQGAKGGELPGGKLAGGRIIDFVGGRADLAGGVVRAIGDPDERFAEDYLRMLRAARFAARFGFALDPATAAAIRPLAQHLGQISRERIGLEIEKMLTGPAPATAAALVQQLGLDEPALNEDPTDPSLPTLAALPEHPCYPVALAAWLIDRTPGSAPAPGSVPASVRPIRHPPSDISHLLPVIGRWRKALCLTNDHRDRLSHLIQGLPRALRWHELDKAQRKRLLAQPIWPELWALLKALSAVHGWPALIEEIEADAGSLRAEGVAPPPLVTGGDLIELGLRPGPGFKQLLAGVYDEQLAGRAVTRDQALAWVRSRA